MAHPLLHAPDIGLGDHPGAERMPQVMEPQRPQCRVLQRPSGALGQRVPVE